MIQRPAHHLVALGAAPVRSLSTTSVSLSPTAPRRRSVVVVADRTFAGEFLSPVRRLG